jgi:hypothetical protein
MTQASENQNKFDQAAVDAVNEMVNIMCPHRMAAELDELILDLVTEKPDTWDEERAQTFKALRALTRTLKENVEPRIFEFIIN